MMGFDDFLRETVVRVAERAIRERDLYVALKSYCIQHSQPAPAWIDFHQLLRARFAKKKTCRSMVLLAGIDWVATGLYQPVEAVSYDLRGREIG